MEIFYSEKQYVKSINARIKHLLESFEVSLEEQDQKNKMKLDGLIKAIKYLKIKNHFLSALEKKRRDKRLRRNIDNFVRYDGKLKSCSVQIQKLDPWRIDWHTKRPRPSRYRRGIRKPQELVEEVGRAVEAGIYSAVEEDQENAVGEGQDQENVVDEGRENAVDEGQKNQEIEYLTEIITIE